MGNSDEFNNIKKEFDERLKTSRKENIKCLRFGIDVKNWDEVLAYINNMEE